MTTGMLFTLLPLCSPAHLLFRSRLAYCSDDCQGRDITSPSISSSSSALSSPHLGGANGADVPPLMPSALGSALNNIRGRGPASLPLSAASAVWSAMGAQDDDDDEGASLVIRAEATDGSELAQDGISKLMYPSALQYARRPSGTNNHSTVPHVHKRMSSSTSSSSGGGHVRGIPRSAPPPSHSSTEDDDVFSDFDIEESDGPSERGSDGGKVKPIEKTKRPRNRTSLPAYFSLLQINSPSKSGVQLSPISSSSGRTVARPSPPTPKTTLTSRQVIDGYMPHTTPRGPRRVPAGSRNHVRSDSSESFSRSRAPPEPEIVTRPAGRDLRPRLDEVDWSSVPGQPSRGRATVRRNSSPPPKVLLGIENRGRTLAAARQAETFNRSRSGEKPRGRARTEELDGIGCLTEAPGFGHGRSGLLGRERDRDRERSLGFVSRIPL